MKVELSSNDRQYIVETIETIIDDDVDELANLELENNHDEIIKLKARLDELRDLRNRIHTADAKDRKTKAKRK